MNELRKTLFKILKHTRIEIDPGEELDISYILFELNDRNIINKEELESILDFLF